MPTQKLVGPQPPPQNVPLHPTPWQQMPRDGASANPTVDIADATGKWAARAASSALADLIIGLVNAEGGKVYRTREDKL